MSLALPSDSTTEPNGRPSALIAGPLQRYTDATTATIWVETDRPGEVTVTAGDRVANARTFTVHGHHYAFVDVSGLQPGEVVEYTVSVGGTRMWPEPGSALPPSTIRTLDPATPVRLLWGSCRQTAGTTAAALRRFGADALRAYAAGLLSGTDTEGAPPPWPDQLLLIGDQIYADEPCDELRDFVTARRDVSEPPHTELSNFAEYAEAYRLAWRDPVVRWFLSNVPSSMIFDDHDIRDDWNTSVAWREEMRTTDWWRDRIVGGLASYAIYQHLGNLSPVERAADPLGALLLDAERAADDLGPDLDKLVARIDDDPVSYRWSYSRQLGPVRLAMIDSRAARVLESDDRDLLNEPSWSWLGETITGQDGTERTTSVEHVVLCSSLPVLLPPSLHYGEQWNEALAEGAWGKRFARVGERLRQTFDLEHWPAFRRAFDRLFGLVGDIAVGKVIVGNSGAAPATVQLFSGDVHFSYLMRVRLRRAARKTAPKHQRTSAVYQVVCSPMRNPLAASFRRVNMIATWRWHIPAAWLVARLAGVRRPAVRWRRKRGLWFDNAVALSEFDGRHSRVSWLTPAGVDRTRTLGEATLS